VLYLEAGNQSSLGKKKYQQYMLTIIMQQNHLMGRHLIIYCFRSKCSLFFFFSRAKPTRDLNSSTFIFEAGNKRVIVKLKVNKIEL